MAATPYQPCAAKVFKSAAVPAPQEGSNPAIVNRIGGAGWLCPFVLIVIFHSNDENSRSRRETDRHLRMYACCLCNARKNLMIFLSRNGREPYRDGLAPSFIAFWNKNHELYAAPIRTSDFSNPFVRRSASSSGGQVAGRGGTAPRHRHAA